MDMKEFKEYFEAVNLGKLHYPGEEAPVDLNSLYKLVTGYRIGEETKVDHIFGILLHGEALIHPHHGRVHNPDFLVLTNSGVSRSDSIGPDYDFPKCGRTYEAPKLKSAGIYLFTRNVVHPITGLYRPDDIVTQAMTQGALVVYDKRIDDFAHEININLPNREVVWGRDRTGNLEGKIN